MADAQPLALTPDQLRWTCDPGQFGFESAEELPIAPGIIGQERAMEAIRLGVRIRSKGHNIFVSGPAGSGRATTVRHLLEQIDSGRGAPPDLVYVHNFREPDHPAALLLPAGRGRELERELREFVLALRRAIPQMYESDDWKRRRKELIELHGNQEKEQVRTLETRVREAQFALVQVQMGPFSRPEVAPLVEGEPRPLDQLESLAAQGKFPVEELARLRQLYDELRTLLEETFKQGRDVHRRLKEALARLEQDYGRPIVVEALEDIKESFCDARLSLHLDQVRDQILSNLRLFIDKEPEEGRSLPGYRSKTTSAIDRSWSTSWSTIPGSLARRSWSRRRRTTATSSARSRRWSTAPDTGGPTSCTSAPEACSAPTEDFSSST